jgi:hypothetical protein
LHPQSAYRPQGALLPFSLSLQELKVRMNFLPVLTEIHGLILATAAYLTVADFFTPCPPREKNKQFVLLPGINR